MEEAAPFDAGTRSGPVPREGTQRRLAAILVADVVGYGRLVAADEAGAVSRLREIWSGLFNPTLAKHRGRVVKMMGDGALVEFASVVDAVECAVAIQNAMSERNARSGDQAPIMFRIGINLGDIIQDGDDILGDGVNIAARLEGQAPHGGILTSDIVRAQVAGKVVATFIDAGEVNLKNIDRPLRVWRIDLGQDCGKSPTGQAERPLALPDKPSIAVLPFVNMSGDAEQDYFCDGITEDIITELSRHRELFVIARNSSFAFKGKVTKVELIAKELGVGYVVEGSVRKAGNRVRVTAQLVEAATGAHIWAERWDRNLDDIFAVQDELVEAIVGRLTRSLDDEGVERARRTPPANLSAYDRLLRGRRDWVRSDFSGAIANLEAAVALDPNLAQAYAIMAFLYGFEAWSLNPDFLNTEGKALDLAHRSIALDERDAHVHAMVGWLYLFQGNHLAALHHTERAVALNPNDATAASFRGGVLAYDGRAREGLQWLGKALRVDPLGWSERWSEVFVETLFMAEDYEACVTAFHRMQNPASYEFATLAACYAYLGRSEDARAAVQEFERRRPTYLTAEVVIQATTKMCRYLKEREHWIEGFRKAGLI